jgi:DNA-binding transcriptional ArsR family regulator
MVDELSMAGSPRAADNRPGAAGGCVHSPQQHTSLYRDTVLHMTHPHSALVPDALLDRVAQRFRVLGDAGRISILRLLMERGELTVGTIVDALDMSQSNASKQLRHLLDAGILARRAEGTSAYYSVVDPSLERLCSIVCDRIESQIKAEAAALG